MRERELLVESIFQQLFQNQKLKNHYLSYLSITFLRLRKYQNFVSPFSLSYNYEFVHEYIIIFEFDMFNNQVKTLDFFIIYNSIVGKNEI